MSVFRLLVVEDDDQDLAVCRDTVKRYKEEQEREVELVECRSVKEAFEKLDNTFDGAIIDLRLDNCGCGGCQVVSRIKESCFRMPVVILTGTPDAIDQSPDYYIKVFKKGDPGAGYDDLLNFFWGIYNAGLTRIMGGRGAIEERLREVFEKNILPQIQKWVEYGKKDSVRTERALLRHTLNHLLQLLDDNEDKFFPEEMYLCPPLSDKIRTGSIVKQNDGRWFVVMNPACDLVIRKEGACKTDRILIVEIDSCSSWFPGCSETERSKKSQEKELEKAYKNNKYAYLHCLHKTDFFEGGFLNFRKISSLSIDEFKNSFEKPKVQISPYFVKDMVARFSAYYARQGQPDIDLEVVQTKSSQ